MLNAISSNFSSLFLAPRARASARTRGPSSGVASLSFALSLSGELRALLAPGV
jgi:hypothetical protein